MSESIFKTRKILQSRYDEVIKSRVKFTEDLKNGAIELYELRKKLMEDIDTIQSIINENESPQWCLEDIECAISHTSDFKMAVEYEGNIDEYTRISDKSGRTAGIFAAAGGAAGAAVAAGGPAAAMSIATLLGTASTGTAISALSGAAATNAALAWIAGGTVAAGGLGVAGGTLILSLFAPLGIAIAGGFGIRAFIKYRKSSEEYVAQLEKELNVLEEDNMLLMEKIPNMNNLIKRTKAFSIDVLQPEVKLIRDNDGGPFSYWIKSGCNSAQIVNIVSKATYYINSRI